MYSCLSIRLPPYLDPLAVTSRPATTVTYQSTNAIQSKAMLSLNANINVDRLDLYKAFLICVCSNLSYRSQMVSSSVSAVTVLQAPIDSVANFALSAKTSLFIFSNWVSYLIRKNAAATIRGIDEHSVTTVNFHPK